MAFRSAALPRPLAVAAFPIPAAGFPDVFLPPAPAAGRWDGTEAFGVFFSDTGFFPAAFGVLPAGRLPAVVELAGGFFRAVPAFAAAPVDPMDAAADFFTAARFAARDPPPDEPAEVEELAGLRTPPTADGTERDACAARLTATRLPAPVRRVVRFRRDAATPAAMTAAPARLRPAVAGAAMAAPAAMTAALPAARASGTPGRGVAGGLALFFVGVGLGAGTGAVVAAGAAAGAVGVMAMLWSLMSGRLLPGCGGVCWSRGESPGDW